MASYTCSHCGMGVTGLKCAKCGTELVHDHITPKMTALRLGWLPALMAAARLNHPNAAVMI